MPLAGLGTWSGVMDPAAAAEVEAAIEGALEVGVRLIDCATAYRNEPAIGKVLKKWIDSGKVKRQDLFIVTKLPLTALDPEAVRPTVEKSLKDLCINYLDLYLIHSPMGCEVENGAIKKNADGKIILKDKADHMGVWREMEKLVDEGKIRSIGVSNFSSPQVANIMGQSRIPVAVNQVECGLYFQNKRLRENMAKMGVKMMAYASLGSSGRDVSRVGSGMIHNVFEDPLVMKIAKEHGKTPAQVLLRHQVQNGIVVIPKSTKKARIQQNFDVFDFSLTSQEMKDLDSQDQGTSCRGFTASFMDWDRKIESIKDYPWGEASGDLY